MISVEIRDCQLSPAPAVAYVNAHKQQDVILAAAQHLNRRICTADESDISYVSLTGRKTRHRPDFVLSCEPENVKTSKSFSSAGALRFTSSTYVGQAIQTVPLTDGKFELVRFDIRPHIGRSLDAYLLTHACGVLLPRGMTAKANGGTGRCAWLLALMWRCAFEKAQRESFMSKAYIPRRANLPFFKGRLDVARQIRENIADASHIACVYKEFSADTVINRTIRRIRKWFEEMDLTSTGLSNLDEYDSRLASLGVPHVDVTPDMIDRTVYTRMTEAYRPMMRLSRIMLGACGGAERSLCIGENAPAYFVDYSEVWENYLLFVMRQELGASFDFYSPNDAGERELLLKGARAIRPDFIVRNKAGEIVAILDAKYKDVSTIGVTERIDTVSRNDLYQMTAYLYHYSSEGRSVKGVFLTCGEVRHEGLLSVNRRMGHWMGVCAFPLKGVDENDDWDSARVAREMSCRAKDFCARLKKMLDQEI